LPEGLEQCVFIEVEEQIVILVELPAKGAIEQLHLWVSEHGKRWHDGDARRSTSPRGQGTGDRGGAGRRSAGFQKLPSGWISHG
jgi:hypothetical protein